MRKIALVVLVALSAFVFLTAASASDSGGRASLNYDYGPVTGDPLRDMAGPSVGSVEYSQEAGQGLRLWIAFKGADPNTNYSWTFWCGPTHDNPIFAADGGAPIRSNGAGNGRASLWIGQAALSLCGPGDHTGHLDLDSAVSTLAATPIFFSARGEENNIPD